MAQNSVDRNGTKTVLIEMAQKQYW